MALPGKRGVLLSKKGETDTTQRLCGRGRVPAAFTLRLSGTDLPGDVPGHQVLREALQVARRRPRGLHPTRLSVRKTGEP